jgi:hypothetical protein
MTRETLFRGLRTDGGGWVEGDLVHHHPTGRTFIAKGLAEPIIEVHPDTVGQYMGLTDKNGKKVFIGDTFRDDEGRLIEVNQMKCGLYVGQYVVDDTVISVSIKPEQTEIIGTIHDHLLEANP